MRWCSTGRTIEALAHGAGYKPTVSRTGMLSNQNVKDLASPGHYSFQRGGIVPNMCDPIVNHAVVRAQIAEGCEQVAVHPSKVLLQ
jgi:hypothetical protein